MDPVSITTTIVTLIAFCSEVANTVQNIKAKYRGANAIISGICLESSLIAINLSQMRELLEADQEAFFSAMKAPGLEEKLDRILIGCLTVFTVLQNTYVQDLQQTIPNLGFIAKMRYFLNKNAMQDILLQLHRMQVGLDFLLSILQSSVLLFCSWMQS